MAQDPEVASELLPLLYAVAVLAAVVALHRRPSYWSTPKLEGRQQNLAWGVAFVLLLPVGVLFHEIGHVLATWLVGGQVAALRWQVYYGSVVPVGDFSRLESWWIALGGSLVGVVLGVGATLLGRGAARLPPWPRLVLLLAGELQLLNTLLFYPALSFGGVYAGSDWEVIYDFAATPAASALTLAAHLAAIGALWVWRERFYELAWAIAHGSQEEVTALRTRIAAGPADREPRIDLACLYLEGQQLRLAAATARDTLRECARTACPASCSRTP